MPQYIKGDLFSHCGEGITVLAHACNPFGSWGGGIAAQFRKRYPHANEIYAKHCHAHTDLLGSCLLVPTSSGHGLDEAILIACLFTSDFKCTQGEILKFTRQSMEDLSNQLQRLETVEKSGSGLPVVNMPQINSGIFNVPWEETEAILNENRLLSINVYTL